MRRLGFESANLSLDPIPITMNKCPKCEAQITKLTITVVPGETKNRSGFECILYSCPSCGSVLSAGIDPVLLANQIITAIKK